MGLTKAERQRNTFNQRKCRCGNCAPLHDSMCNSCRQDFDHESKKNEALHDCETVDDIKEFLKEWVL